MNSILRSASVLALVSGALAAHAGLLGSTVDFRRADEGANTIQDFGNRVVVDPGVEYQGVRGGLYNIDLTDSTLTISNALAGSTISLSGGFTGSVVSGPSFLTATYLSGLRPKSATVTDGLLFIDYTDLFFGVGQSSSFSITTNPTPEPSALAALGLGAVAFVKRRRKG